MNLPLFVIYDTVSDSVAVVGTANNAKTFIRQNLPYLSKINPNYLAEYKLFQVGSLIESTLSLVASPSPEQIDWSIYSSTPEKND